MLNVNLPFHPHTKLAAVLLELPGVEPARGGQAQIDATMPGEILRGLGNGRAS